MTMRPRGLAIALPNPGNPFGDRAYPPEPQAPAPALPPPACWQETFGTNHASSWGASWSPTTVGGATLAVTGGVGVMNMPALGIGGFSFASLSRADVAEVSTDGFEATYEFRVSDWPPIGDPFNPSASTLDVGMWFGGTTGLFLKAYTEGGVRTWDIYEATNAGEATLPEAVPADEWLSAKVRWEADGTVRLRFWQTGTPEPDWQLTTTKPSMGAPGAVEAMAVAGGPTGAIAVEFRNIEVCPL